MSGQRGKIETYETADNSLISSVDHLKVFVFGHFGQILIFLEDGQSGAEEIERLVANQLAATRAKCR